ncbi:hypothetical protein P5673_013228 [Acropora cervicornis]|uniref:Uncharacterized protein n=1 Tax=Acropora cervicornis TaxID=6130 RepID=A0AAD9QLJ0_ACRCE|nr:hypothetical protein P5673_013228 [Acropora cervicornis]
MIKVLLAIVEEVLCGIPRTSCRVQGKEQDETEVAMQTCKFYLKAGWSDSLIVNFAVGNVNYCQNIDMGHFEFQTQQNGQNTVEIKLNFL